MRTNLCWFFFPSTLAICFGLTACGGGGGGGDNLNCDPGEYRYDPPAGIGSAGPMDGTYSIAARSLIPDPRMRNADLNEASLFEAGELIEFRDGVVYQGDDPGDPGPGSNPDPSVSTTVEFICNDRDGPLTLYGFGARVTAPNLGQVVARRMAVIGTVSAFGAKAYVVEEDIIPFTATDRLMVYECDLVRLP